MGTATHPTPQLTSIQLLTLAEEDHHEMGDPGNDQPVSPFKRRTLSFSSHLSFVHLSRAPLARLSAFASIPASSPTVQRRLSPSLHPSLSVMALTFLRGGFFQGSSCRG